MFKWRQTGLKMYLFAAPLATSSVICDVTAGRPRLAAYFARWHAANLISAGESVVYSDTEDIDQQENGCICSQPFILEPEPDNDEHEQVLGMSISNPTGEAQPASSASQS